MPTSFKKTARRQYRKIKFVACPAFPREKIIFNSKGFNHLFYQGSTKARTRAKLETSVRVKLLPRAIKLLRLMPLPQEESSYLLEKKRYQFWAFEGVVDNKRIKVIVRQIGNGNKHFWSVIPGWRKSRFGRKNAKGSLARQ